MQTSLPLPGRRQGKVRDIYDGRLADGRGVLVIVASDRISAFDVVMPNPVPGKGIVLTQISNFWFDMIARKLGEKLEHHVISTDPADIPGLSDEQRRALDRRVVVGRKCKVVPIECVVRGYLAGSGWAEYRQSQTVCGIKLPPGLEQCDKLEEPIFTPATKAATGHDENISFARACELVGAGLMATLRDLSIAIYKMARDYAAGRGIIIADTKFEFGLPLDSSPLAGEGGLRSKPGEGGAPIDVVESNPHPSPLPGRERGPEQPILIDEVLTPDSSRFWPADQYQPGRDQPSFDKQYLRNYLQELVDRGRWDKTPPGPVLPDEVMRGTLAKYLDAYRLLTGRTLEL